MRLGKCLLAFSVLALVVSLSQPVHANDSGTEYYFLTAPTENRVSFTLSNYFYSEPNLEVTFAGPKGGIGYYRVQPLTESFFGIFEIDYRFGATEYSSPGIHIKGISDHFLEGKIALGRDFSFENFAISPYVGLGYRRLFNQFSTDANGYDRTSQYWYIPVGLIHRIDLGSDARLETTIEGNILLVGYQESELSQFSEDLSDVTNTQSSGHGIKASMMFQRENWGIGPYLNYWHVANSDSVSGSCYTDQVCTVFEPANSTMEYGLEIQLSVHGLSSSSSIDGLSTTSRDHLSLYAGIQGSFLVPKFNVTNDILGNGEVIVENAAELVSGALGVYLGGEIQASDNIALGIELDVNTTNASQSGGAFTARDLKIPVESSYNYNSYGSARLRVGYTFDNLMPYITGGIALANFEFGSKDTEEQIQFAGSEWVYGYTLGGGVEYMINDRFRIRADYRYSDFGKNNIIFESFYQEMPNTTYEVDLKTQALTLGVGIVF